MTRATKTIATKDTKTPHPTREIDKNRDQWRREELECCNDRCSLWLPSWWPYRWSEDRRDRLGRQVQNLCWKNSQVEDGRDGERQRRHADRIHMDRGRLGAALLHVQHDHDAQIEEDRDDA